MTKSRTPWEDEAEPQSPWENEAERFGIGAMIFLDQMCPKWQGAGRALIEKSVARGEGKLERLESLLRFDRAMRDFEQARPSTYHGTARKFEWAERCVALIAGGQPKAKIVDLCFEAYNRTEPGAECAIGEFSRLQRAALNARSNKDPDKKPSDVSKQTIRGWIRRVEQQRSRGGAATKPLAPSGIVSRPPKG